MKVDEFNVHVRRVLVPVALLLLLLVCHALVLGEHADTAQEVGHELRVTLARRALRVLLRAGLRELVLFAGQSADQRIVRRLLLLLRRIRVLEGKALVEPNG